MEKLKKDKTALSVAGGVEQPSVTNADSIEKFKKKKKKKFNVKELTEGILKGNISMLSKAITLVESSLPKHEKIAHKIINKCLPYSGKSLRIGITGVPGVGKSTFIEAFGKYLTSEGHKVAVLAVDPSSGRTKGSILGDKTRMESLSTDENAFIRPSPSAGSLGGVARKTRETVFLCEAAGFDVIIIETVGVGQSEIAVHSMTDFFLLLMLAGAGDELQGIKRGVMEMADLIAITKADGGNEDKANIARMEYAGALHLFPPAGSGWKPDVVTCSAKSLMGINHIWERILNYKILTEENGFFKVNRQKQTQYWMFETIEDQLKTNFYNHPEVSEEIISIKDKVLNKQLCSFSAANKLLSKYFESLEKGRD